MLELIGMFIGVVGLSLCIRALVLSNKKSKYDLVIVRKEPTIRDCYWTRK